jgi:hypothetical protein
MTSSSALGASLLKQVLITPGLVRFTSGPERPRRGLCWALLTINGITGVSRAPSPPYRRRVASRCNTNLKGGRGHHPAKHHEGKAAPKASFAERFLPVLSIIKKNHWANDACPTYLCPLREGEHLLEDVQHYIQHSFKEGNESAMHLRVTPRNIHTRHMARRAHINSTQQSHREATAYVYIYI